LGNIRIWVAYYVETAYWNHFDTPAYPGSVCKRLQLDIILT
jgi:hypothetical protein